MNAIKGIYYYYNLTDFIITSIIKFIGKTLYSDFVAERKTSATSIIIM